MCDSTSSIYCLDSIAQWLECWHMIHMLEAKLSSSPSWDFTFLTPCYNTLTFYLKWWIEISASGRNLIKSRGEQAGEEMNKYQIGQPNKLLVFYWHVLFTSTESTESLPSYLLCFELRKPIHPLKVLKSQTCIFYHYQ